MNLTRREFLVSSATAAVAAALPVGLMIPTDEEITVRWSSDYDMHHDSFAVSGTVGTKDQKWCVSMQCKEDEVDELKPMLQKTLYEHLVNSGVRTDKLIELGANG